MSALWDAVTPTSFNNHLVFALQYSDLGKAFWTFIRDDTLIALGLFGMSFTGVALVIWRLLLNLNSGTNMSEFLPTFQHTLEKEGVEGALDLCRNRTDLIPKKLFVAGLESYKQGLAAVRRAIGNVVELEILPDLNFLLPVILAIAKIATMVGLLGTVISMIGTFNKIQEATGGGGAAGQAKEIGLALFATALGLITAIPLVFAHVLFKAWVQKYETKMKSAANKLILLLQAKPPLNKPAAKPAGGAAQASAGAAAQTGAQGVQPSPTTARR